MKKAYIISSGIIAVSLLAFFIFIPAFTGNIQIDPVIQLGSFQLRWYGLILAASILVSYAVARKNSWKFGISINDVDDYSFWAVIVGFLGARIYYVVFNADYFFRNPNQIYQVWHGGLSVYGAILSGLLFTYIYSRKKAYSFGHLFDLVALSLPLGQALGRFGNFVNQEGYGSVTNLPWKMYVRADGQYHHPAFLYESLLDVVVFFLLYKLLGKTKPAVLGLVYLIAYSLGRFFIEAIRVDSFFISGFRVDQIVAFLIVVIAGFFALRKQSKLVS